MTAGSEILEILRLRFKQNPQRHQGIEWTAVAERLAAHPDKLMILNEMEATGGEPDVIGVDQATGQFLFVDCSPETPTGRRSLCYDQDALNARKANKPKSSAMSQAHAIGIELLSEEEYHALQQVGEFDLKTSSWLKTPDAVRKLGGAIFGDRRYDRVFIYHNGADSYYGARGYRGILRV